MEFNGFVCSSVLDLLAPDFGLYLLPPLPLKVFSKIIWSLKAQSHVEHQRDRHMNISSAYMGHMTRMVTMAIYRKKQRKKNEIKQC